MMGNVGLGLELDLRKEIKGEDQRDKREVGGKRKGLLTLRNPGEKEERKKTREKVRKEGRSQLKTNIF